jgi:hypothetical protein
MVGEHQGSDDAGCGYQALVERVRDLLINNIAWALNHAVPIIAGHDYCPLYESVMKAVQEGFGESVRVKGSVWSGCSISSQSC